MTVPLGCRSPARVVARSLAHASNRTNRRKTHALALSRSRSRSLARAHPRASSSLAPSTNPRKDSFPSEVTTDTFTHTRTHGTYIDCKNTTRRTRTDRMYRFVRVYVRRAGVFIFYVHRCGIHDPYSKSREPMCARTCVPITNGARLSARETKRRLIDRLERPTTDRVDATPDGDACG